jgi:predicted transcriptional regulator
MDRPPVITKQIIEMVTAEPGLTAKVIAERVQKKEKTIKVVLHRLVTTNRIAREKVDHAVKSKSGPKAVYVYKALTL